MVGGPGLVGAVWGLDGAWVGAMVWLRIKVGLRWV